jgi:hypothetical protein
MPVGGAREFAEILLGMNVKKFQKGAKAAITASKRMADKMKAHQAGLRSLSLKAGIALGAQALFIRKVTQAASTQELAEKKLADAVLKHEGATMANVEALKKQAAALQKVTQFGDEATIEAQALLATYGVAPEKMEAATQAMVDFAAATGRDLKTAALTVGKAVGAGFTGELSRYGIILDTSTIPKTEVATEVLKKLNEQFGGRAQKTAETYAGRLARLKNATGDLYEQIGFALFPILESLFDKIRPLIEQAGEWIRSHQKLTAVIGIAGVGGTGLLFALAMLGLALPGIVTAIGAMLSPIGLAVGAIGAMVAAVMLLTGRMPPLHTRLNEFQKFQAQLNAEIAEGNKKVSESEERSKALKSEIEGLTKKVAEGGSESKRYAGRLAEAKRELSESEEATKNLREETEALTEAQRDQERLKLAALIAENRREYEGMISVQEQANNRTFASARAFESQMRSTEVSSRELARNREELRLLTEQLIALNPWAQRTAESMSDIAQPKGRIAPSWMTAEPGGEQPPMPEPMTDEQVGEFQDRFDIINEELDRYSGHISTVEDDVSNARARMQNDFDAWAESQGAFAANFASSWASAFTAVLQSEKNVSKALGKSLVIALIETFKQVIKTYTAMITADKLKEIGHATIQAPLSFGATLAAIGPIIAAATIAIAGLNALEAKFVGSFEKGIPFVPQTGIAQVHRGEMIVPASQAAAMRAGAGGSIYAPANFFGPINSELDLKNAGRVIAEHLQHVYSGSPS